MLNRIVWFGVLGGLIVGIPNFLMPIVVKGHLPMTLAMVIGYVTMLVALTTVFLAIKQVRDRELGGVIRFWRAFAVGLAVSFIASLFYIAAWEAAMAVTHMDFPTAYANALIAEKRAAGADEATIAKLAAEMETFRRQYANPLFRLPMTFIEIFPVGVIVSLVSAALLRNSRFLAQRRERAIA